MGRWLLEYSLMMIFQDTCLKLTWKLITSVVHLNIIFKFHHLLMNLTPSTLFFYGLPPPNAPFGLSWQNTDNSYQQDT